VENEVGAAVSSSLTTAKLREIEDELKDDKKFRAAEKRRKAVKKRADKKKADAKKEKEKKGNGKGQGAGLTTVTPKTKVLLADKPVRKKRIAKKTRAPKKKKDEDDS
jgi:ribosome-interacting GTPase 1